MTHHDLPRQIVGVTFRLADSVPARLLRIYARILEAAAEHGLASEAEKRVRSHLEYHLAKGKGSGILRDPRAATIVEHELRAGCPRDYRLIAWVVMPNHVHVLIERTMLSNLPAIVRRWKGASARRINQLFGRTGPLCFRDYFDRDIEVDDDQLRRTVLYIELNPVKAGLCRLPAEWPFSSARHSNHWNRASCDENP